VTRNLKEIIGYNIKTEVAKKQKYKSVLSEIKGQGRGKRDVR